MMRPGVSTGCVKPAADLLRRKGLAVSTLMFFDNRVLIDQAGLRSGEESLTELVAELARIQGLTP